MERKWRERNEDSEFLHSTFDILYIYTLSHSHINVLLDEFKFFYNFLIINPMIY